MSETPDEGPTYPDGYEPAPEPPDADRSWKFPESALVKGTPDE